MEGASRRRKTALLCAKYVRANFTVEKYISFSASGGAGMNYGRRYLTRDRAYFSRENLRFVCMCYVCFAPFEHAGFFIISSYDSSQKMYKYLFCLYTF